MSEKKYFAFISYKSEDVEWATWLQHELEHYHLPASFNGRDDVPKELRPVFRDVDELCAGNLPKQINEALFNSQNLIVICSPQAAKSPWVNQEVETFMSFGRTEHIFPFIIEGSTPSEFFPPALLNLPKDDERLGGDINKKGRDAAFVKVVAGMLGMAFDLLWNRYEKEKAEEERKQREQRNKLLISQSRFVAEKADTLTSKGDNNMALRLLLEVLPTDIANPNRPCPSEVEASMRRAYGRSNAVHSIKSKTPYYVAILPNQKHLFSVFFPQTVCIWDLSSGACVMKRESLVNMYELIDLCPDGKIFATVSEGNTISLWDTEMIFCYKTFGGQASNINAIKFSPNGGKIVAASNDGTVRIWDVKRGRIIRTLKAHSEPVLAVCFTLDSKRIITSAKKRMSIWDVDTGHCLKVIKTPAGDVAIISLSHDGDKIATTMKDSCKIQLWNIKSGECIGILDGHEMKVTSAIFCPNGKHILSTSYDKTIRLWDILTGHCLQIWEGHTDAVDAVTCTRTMDSIVSVSDDMTIRVWDNTPYPCLYTLAGHADVITSIAYSPDGHFLISSSHDKTIRVWNATNGRCLYILEGHTGWVQKAVFSYDGTIILSASTDSTIRLWNAFDGKCLYVFKGHACGVSHLLISPDGKKFVSASDDGTILIWDILTRQLICSIAGQLNMGIRSITLSPGGDTVAFTLEYGTDIFVHDVSTGQRKRVLKGHILAIEKLLFSPDGHILFSASYDKTARLWNMASGQCIRKYEGLPDYGSPIAINDSQIAFCIGYHNILLNNITSSEYPLSLDASGAISLSFSQDGKYLMSYHSSTDCKCIINIWNANDGVLLQTIYDVASDGNEAIFNPNGKQIATHRLCGTIKIWDFRPLQELIDNTRTRFESNPLTQEERKKYYLE